MAKPNSTAIVTGAAIRVGRAMAEALAGAGYDIALHYNSSEQEAEKAAAAIRKLGRKCTLFRADLGLPALPLREGRSEQAERGSDREGLGNGSVSNALPPTTRPTASSAPPQGGSEGYTVLMERIFAAHPDCNVLVNSASIFERCGFMDTTEDIFDRHMTINFKAPFFLTQAFAKAGGRGVVVNMLDTYVTRTTGAYFSYLLSKKALHEFTAMAAKALAPGIRVNGICPGTLLTSPAHPTEADVAAAAARMPLGKPATLKDITDTLLFLVQSESLTGQCIFVDSGQKVA